MSVIRRPEDYLIEEADGEVQEYIDQLEECIAVFVREEADFDAETDSDAISKFYEKYCQSAYESLLVKVPDRSVIKNRKTGEKIVVYGESEIHTSEFEVVADRPHGDGDYSYLCNSQYCRCKQ